MITERALCLAFIIIFYMPTLCLAGTSVDLRFAQPTLCLAGTSTVALIIIIQDTIDPLFCTAYIMLRRHLRGHITRHQPAR
jgi:hypothetical protein